MIKSAARIPSLLLLLLSLSFFACQQTNDPGTPRETEAVSGILQDEEGLALPEALIEAVDQASTVLASDTSDEDGRFSLMLPKDVGSIKIRILRDDLKPFLKDLSEFIQRAGGKSGIVLSGDHEDSCCGKIGLTIGGMNEMLNDVEVKLRKGDHLISKSYTNDHGQLTFHHLCAGKYNIRIAKDGFKVKEEIIEIGEDCDSAGFAFELESNGQVEEDTCCGSAVNIIVKDSATQDVMEGVQVRLQKGDHKIVKTTDNGAATFNELCEGVYAVRIAREGYKVMEFSIEVGCDTEVNLTKLLAKMQNHNDDSCCHGLIKLFVKNSGGEVLNHATVKLWKGGQLLKTLTMSSEGVTFKDLCKGDYGISINAEGYNGMEFNIGLDCNDTLETFNKVLTPKNSGGDTCCKGVLFLALKEDGTDTRISNATVKLWKGNQLLKTGTTNGDGVVKFDGLCPGEYSISMMREGFTGKEFGDIFFECSDTLEFQKTLVKNGNTECCTAALKFRMKDSTEQTYLSGATIKIFKEGALLATITSGDEGWAMKEGLCGHTTYTVVFLKDGYVTQEHHFTFTDCKLLQETIWMVRE